MSLVFSLVALERNKGLVGLQVDKGTAGLNGTNGETTTQGAFSDLLEGFLKVSVTIVIQATPPQVLMGCRSAAPSIKRMVVTLPSGGACSRSQMAAPRLLPLRRMPTCWPDTLASVNR